MKIWSMMQLQWLGLLAFFPLSSPGGMQTQTEKSKIFLGNGGLSWTASPVTHYNAHSQTYYTFTQTIQTILKMLCKEKQGASSKIEKRIRRWPNAITSIYRGEALGCNGSQQPPFPSHSPASLCRDLLCTTWYEDQPLRWRSCQGG